MTVAGTWGDGPNPFPAGSNWAWDDPSLVAMEGHLRTGQPVRIEDVADDIPGRHFDDLTARQRDGVIAAHPRLGFKDGILEALTGGLRDKPETAFAPWQTDHLAAAMPGYVRESFCDVVRRSRFAS